MPVAKRENRTFKLAWISFLVIVTNPCRTVRRSRCSCFSSSSILHGDNCFQQLLDHHIRRDHVGMSVEMCVQCHRLRKNYTKKPRRLREGGFSSKFHVKLETLISRQKWRTDRPFTQHFYTEFTTRETGLRASGTPGQPPLPSASLWVTLSEWMFDVCLRPVSRVVNFV